MSTKVATYGQPQAGHVQTEAAPVSASSNQPHGVFIDKLSMTFDIHDEGHGSWINQQFMDLPKEVDSGWFPGHRGAYKYGVRVHTPSDVTDGVQGPWSKDYVLLQACPKNGQGGYLRAEFNPARFDACQTAYIFGSLDTNLDLPPPQVGKAKVTRADVTVDLPGVKIGDHVFERTNSPIRRIILNKGRLETIYLGKTAAGQACIYDKGAQVGNDALTLTRVEVQLTWDRVDLKDGWFDFNVPGVEITKKRRPVAPINFKLARALRAARPAPGSNSKRHVIGSKPEPMSAVWVAFRSACKRAKLEGVTPHTLKHTMITWGLAKASPWDVSGVTATSLATLTTIYGKHMKGHLKSAVAAMATK